MKTLLVAAFLLSCFSCFSQDALSKLNLAQCIELALKNNLEVAKKAIMAEGTRINLQQEKANLLPSFNAGITHGLNQGRSINPSTNSYVTKEVAYAAPYIGSSLLLFNGLAQQHIIKQYSLLYQVAKQEEQQTKNELILAVTLAYLEVLTNQELLNLSKIRQQTTIKQLDRLETLNKNGAIAPGVYFDLKGQYANDKLIVINTHSALENSKIALVRLLNIPYSNTLQLEQISTHQFTLNYESNTKQIYQNALKSFASLKASELRKKGSELQLKSNRAMYYPSVNFNSRFSSNYASTESGSYQGQFDDNLYKTFQVSLSIPIFNSFKTKNNIVLSKLTLRESELIEQTTKTQLQQLIEQAYLNMATSRERAMGLKEQADAYQESFRTAEILFNSGVINSRDYLIAKNNLETVKAEMLANQYDFILRKKILDFYQGKQLGL